jgi:hypothetical protein
LETIFKNFPSIIPDNEEHYYNTLRGVIDSVDPQSSALITKRISGVSFRITPSSSSHLNSIITEVNRLNTMFGIRVDFSKSIKTSFTINFSIDF